MDNISIKDHPPWYARGTPVSNTRDGPAMAMSDKPLFANPITIGCRGPSARGELKEIFRPWPTIIGFDADRSGDAVRSVEAFDLSACEAPDNVKMMGYHDADRSGDAVRSGEDADLSACAAPDNVNMINDNNNVDRIYFKQTNQNRWNMNI
ncbi:MAG: hypothetical protein FD166_3640 [Bacteroidetes bacterium]|nr:MAG: hypothetical protein FD166_3640 [Bacteroidota bacterium]